MPRLKTVVYYLGRKKYEHPRETAMSVNVDGTFHIPIPPEIVEKLAWPSSKISAKTADECEKAFKDLVERYVNAAETRERMIAIKFESALADTPYDTLRIREALALEIGFVERRTLKMSDRSVVTYVDDPLVVHTGPDALIPCQMHIPAGSIQSNMRKLVLIPWSQDLQDWLVRVVMSIKGIADVLAKYMRTEAGVIEAMNAGHLLGPGMHSTEEGP